MDYKQAEKRYKFLMAVMVIVLVLSVAPVMLAVYKFFMAQSTGADMDLGSMIFAVLSLAVGVLMVLVIAGPMKEAKEYAMYDEFGVRRNAGGRLNLNSKDREELEKQALAELEKVIPRTALEKMRHEGSLNPDADLDSMVGIEPVKKRVLEMKARMAFEDKNGDIDAAKSEGHHMIFTGRPGTGKTTLARIIAGFLYEYEYIDENKVIEVDGNFLKSGDANMTQLKVRYVCRAAMGGVLFIDEAYALTQSKDPAGLQAVATLIKEMEDKRGQFVVILAGYTKEMKDMLDSNPGFRSRIKEYLDFPDYTDEEIFSIFCKMANDKGFFASSKDESLKKAVFERISRERVLPSWGNARTARNVLEETIDRHAYRITQGEIPKEDAKKMLRIIQSEDIPKYPKETV